MAAFTSVELHTRFHVDPQLNIQRTGRKAVFRADLRLDDNICQGGIFVVPPEVHFANRAVSSRKSNLTPVHIEGQVKHSILYTLIQRTEYHSLAVLENVVLHGLDLRDEHSFCVFSRINGIHLMWLVLQWNKRPRYTTVRGIIGESETIHHVIHVQFPPDTGRK